MTVESARRRASSALAMRTAGADYEEIRETLGFRSVAHARGVVERELVAQSPDPDGEQAARRRELAGKRFERLLRGLWSKAINPDSPEHLAAVRTAADLITRHSKLLGYEAPTEVVVHSPSTEEIAAWVLMVQEQAARPTVIEADIFAIEAGDGHDAQAG